MNRRQTRADALLASAEPSTAKGVLMSRGDVGGRSVVANVSQPAESTFPRLEGGNVPVSAKGRRTRDRLLRAARAVFERDGFLEARVADIADEAGVAHGTFYTYFDSKPEIFRTVVANVMEQVWYTRASTDGDPHLSPFEAIDRANRQFVRVYREHGAMLGLMEQAITYDSELRDLRLMVRKRSVERVRRSIERMQSDGTVRTDVDAQVAAAAMVSMVSNFVYFWLVLDEGDYDDEQAVAALSKLWASALEMQLPEPGAAPGDDHPTTN